VLDRTGLANLGDIVAEIAPPPRAFATASASFVLHEIARFRHVHGREPHPTVAQVLVRKLWTAQL